jgi:hypothetical protein
VQDAFGLFVRGRAGRSTVVVTSSATLTQWERYQPRNSKVGIQVFLAGVRSGQLLNPHIPHIIWLSSRALCLTEIIQQALRNVGCCDGKSQLTPNEGTVAVDTEPVDRQFSALQQQAQQTATLIQTLAGKLSNAATAGDPNAREWALDLKEIALAIRDEQGTTTELLQAIHALVDNHVAAAGPSPPSYYPPPAQYAQPPQYQAPYQPQYQQPGGGALQRFLGGRFGQAIVTGAGIGIGDDIVNSIFDRL